MILAADAPTDAQWIQFMGMLKVLAWVGGGLIGAFAIRAGVISVKQSIIKGASVTVADFEKYKVENRNERAAEIDAVMTRISTLSSDMAGIKTVGDSNKEMLTELVKHLLPKRDRDR
jgi:hypothetical protein